MFQAAQHILGCAIGAVDGTIGEITDLYFDDLEWKVRYLVVETSHWLNRSSVLIAPRSLEYPAWERRLLLASITIDQVKNGPNIDTTKPVSRKHEALFLSHYHHPRYWENAGPPAIAQGPPIQNADAEFCWSDEHFTRAVADRERTAVSARAQAELHLRSYRAILGYSVRARDGVIGRVTGMLTSDDDWAVRYLIAHTGHWWAGHQVLLAVQWIARVSWLGSCINVDISRGLLCEAPAYDPAAGFDRAQEAKLTEYCSAQESR